VIHSILDPARPAILRRMKRAMALAILISACGGAAEVTPTAVTVRPNPNAVELALRRSDGEFVDVGELRGRVVLIFLFATFDTGSQLAIHYLRRIREELPEVEVIGIAAQPGARLLIDAYVHALSPPFTVAYDPEETVAEGRSALGEIEGVPMFVVLDRSGVERGRLVGIATDEQLRALIERAD
jgi:hypothetical protein